jgi:hypothetical protein
MLSLEAWGSALSFVGAFFLSIESLWARHRIPVEIGFAIFRNEVLPKTGEVLKDENGKALYSEKDLKLHLTKRYRRYSWIGFVLMTFGFALDFCSKVRK